MSTRTQIGFYEKDSALENPHTLLYRHSDGYPGDPDKNEYGVLTDLIPFCTNFIKNRGFDIEYIGARALCYLIHKHTEDLPGQAGWKDKIYPFGGFLSYGICRPGAFHGDIEYYYAVYCDRIDVYECGFFAEQPGDWVKISTVTSNADKTYKYLSLT